MNTINTATTELQFYIEIRKPLYEKDWYLLSDHEGKTLLIIMIDEIAEIKIPWINTYDDACLFISTINSKFEG